jgi:hypothetical protein
MEVLELITPVARILRLGEEPGSALGFMPRLVLSARNFKKAEILRFRSV